MPFITLEGLNYHYFAGMPKNKEPRQTILFIHGAGGSHCHWLYQLNGLKEDYLVLAVDLPGHGQSQGKASDAIAAYRQFVYAFAERLIGHPFFLAGHSMGGAITLDFARCYPEKLAGMVLIGTGARLRVLPALLETFQRGEHYAELIQLAYGKNAPPALLEAARREMESVPPSVYLADFTACNGFDLMGVLPFIDVPALVIAADQDLLTPLKYGQYLKQKLPRAELEIIHGTGHMIMLERPGKINAIIKRFLEEHSTITGNHWVNQDE
ncbi:alpha/beta fold hydrolase [Desulfofundulus thermosubterraneus]|uniref:Pimeloyl-ACP methyl ester carboxylesterase n=1 Tax=Desulfofundulus thermosubterraneus DSM 16057 TaxID=1121432 RepID=A0A1M6DFB6_9FIRM|nr:alpha/beta hydrolase [Desulfofundulus thermosubterraneus]SHI72054.1 Pimeloyl-ACP methyl ester carboxylesterase [Desulfofundulus thermosubterraneus DSM 16057]